MATKMKMAEVLVSLLPVLTFVSPAHAKHIEETGLGQAFDDEGKTQDDLCREARKDAERKVPRGAENVKYIEPVFKGYSLHGKSAHNCLVYVSFDYTEVDDEANPFKLEDELKPPTWDRPHKKDIPDVPPAKARSIPASVPTGPAGKPPSLPSGKPPVPSGKSVDTVSTITGGDPKGVRLDADVQKSGPLKDVNRSDILKLLRKPDS